jgi:hypothetical protein
MDMAEAFADQIFNPDPANPDDSVNLLHNSSFWLDGGPPAAHGGFEYSDFEESFQCWKDLDEMRNLWQAELGRLLVKHNNNMQEAWAEFMQEARLDDLPRAKHQGQREISEFFNSIFKNLLQNLLKGEVDFKGAALDAIFDKISHMIDQGKDLDYLLRLVGPDGLDDLFDGLRFIAMVGYINAYMEMWASDAHTDQNGIRGDNNSRSPCNSASENSALSRLRNMAQSIADRLHVHVSPSSGPIDLPIHRLPGAGGRW